MGQGGHNSITNYFDLQTTAKKWTKVKNARAGRAKLLFLSFVTFCHRKPPPWGNMGHGWGFVESLIFCLARGGGGLIIFCVAFPERWGISTFWPLLFPMGWWISTF